MGNPVLDRSLQEEPDASAIHRNRRHFLRMFHGKLRGAADEDLQNTERGGAAQELVRASCKSPAQCTQKCAFVMTYSVLLELIAA